MPAGVFAGLPGLQVVMRSAIDIRNIDVAAASQAGVLVTQAEAGFVQSVVELTLGLLVDLSRGVSRAAPTTTPAACPRSGSAGSSAAAPSASSATAASRARWRRARALGITVLVSDPYAQVDDPRFVKLPLEDCSAAPTTSLPRHRQRGDREPDERGGLRRMRPDAFFINMSRGNLVDEAALAGR